MLYYVLKVALTAAVIVAVSEIAKRHTALAALLAALPLTSLLAFVWFHLEGASAVQVAALSRGIFWLVLPSLLFFVLFPTLLERGVSFTPVGGIRSAAYGDPALKMVPAVYYRRPDLSFVRVLDWGRGHRFGIVLGQKREDPVVMAYVRALQQQLPSLSEKLFGLKLEPVEE